MFGLKRGDLRSNWEMEQRGGREDRDTVTVR